MHIVINEAKPDFDKAIEYLHKELSMIRTGRANPSLVENVQVEVYGTLTPLKGVASINVPDSKTLSIEPWDKNNVKAIEKALIEADLGITPSVDSNIVRLSMPQMTEENRQQMVKKVKEKLEEARVKARSVRESVRERVNKLEKDKEIAEDEKYKLLEDIDKITKEYTDNIDEIGKQKEQEVMTV